MYIQRTENLQLSERMRLFWKVFEEKNLSVSLILVLNPSLLISALILSDWRHLSSLCDDITGGYTGVLRLQ